MKTEYQVWRKTPDGELGRGFVLRVRTRSSTFFMIEETEKL